ncbi:MAG TPA: phosphate signaling complex protein PhoU [Acidimicrobiia bacterium]|jgi:phosphate transport system protein|nr:phosphate signaling complex protein PhoU [Acidimicrobiia bacterium]
MTPHRSFHASLEKLEADTLEMGRRVRAQVAEAVTALDARDRSRAERVVEGDRAIDELYLELHGQWMVLTATQGPMGSDLRLLASLLHLLVVLERMGDQASNIAKMVIATDGLPGDPRLAGLLSAMGEAVLPIADRSLAGFAARDDSAVEEMKRLDTEVDGFYSDTIDAAVAIGDERSVLEWATRMIMAARALERVADQAVDIAEETRLLVTGERDIYPSGIP